jgi:hypothetical protein
VQKIYFVSVSFLQEYTDVSEKRTVPNLRSARYLFLLGLASTPNMETVRSSLNVLRLVPDYTASNPRILRSLYSQS